MTKPDLVETVAEIIAPRAFEMWQSLYNYCLPRDGEKKARWTAELAHGESCDGARTKARDILALPGLAPAPVGDDWLPTPENVNALPKPLRDFIHELTCGQADYTGIVQELICRRDQVGQLEASVADLQAENERLKLRLLDAHAALRSIAEGNLGDQPWQAGYETIRQVARNALPESQRDAALSEPQAQKGSAWRPGSEAPDVKSGRSGYFIVAVRWPSNRKVCSFPAVYINAMPLWFEQDNEERNVTGWFSATADEDGQGETYRQLVGDGDQLVAWTDVPQFPAAPLTTEGGE